MVAKRALIVDDSRSARTFLSRVLEKYEIEVDSAESAEQAIEYLGSRRPDVIFMDHLMPGMDGFQAVQAIKNNPRTAMIPIMMYTSQEGELYLGQARALGAVGVLPKQIKPTDVSKVLYELHLLPDRRSTEQSSFRPVAVAIAEDDAQQETVVAPRPLTDATLREHFAELRRVLVASLDSQTDRVTSDVRMILQDAQAQAQAQAAERERAAQARRPLMPWVLAALALVLAAVSGLAWWQELALRQRLAAQITALRERPAASRAPRADAPAGEPPALQAAIPQPPPAAPQITTAAGPAAVTTDSAGSAGAATSSALGSAPSAPKVQTADAAQQLVEIVPYGTEPLAEPRLEVLRQLFDRLTAEGFRGTVEIKTYGGRFCLVGSAAEGYSLPPDDGPFAKCDVLAGPADEAASQAQRVPLPFANLTGAFRARNHDAVDVQVLPGDPTVLAVPYPQVSASLTAGEWNRAASANNRIEIRVR